MTNRERSRIKPGLWLLAIVIADHGIAEPKAVAQDTIAICTSRLKTIHQALLNYERKYQQWPDHLSNLVPEFLPDPTALRDPADPGTGTLGSDEAHPDPKFRVSYSYERNNDVSNGLAQPLVPFPKPDIAGTAWGSWRLVNAHMESCFGDQVPLVRCYHHRVTEEEREPGQDTVLNLTPSGRIYRSDYDWRRHPDSIGFMLKTLERDLSQPPGWVLRAWLLWRVDEFLSHESGLSRERQGPLMQAVAEALLRQHRDLKGEERTSCRIAARLFAASGLHDRALASLDAAREFPSTAWQPIVENQLRAEIHHAAHRWNDEIATYHALLAERPDVRPYMESLAAAYEAAGKQDTARTWRDKADPGRLLIGKQAPDFQVTLVKNESELTLQGILKGQKAVLLDFWFCACAPCRLSFPHLEQLHKNLGPKGLAIVAVNSGDTRESIVQFAQNQNASFLLGLGRRDGKDNPIFRSYFVSSFPTAFLIDSSGKIVWRGVGYGKELKSELEAALGKLNLTLMTR